VNNKVKKGNIKRMPNGASAVGCAVPITRDMYEKMWALYKDGTTAFSISKQLHISHKTVVKYIREGNEKRGMAPLINRLSEMNKKCKERIFDVYATKKKKHFDNADRAFTASMGIAMSTLQMVNDYIAKGQKNSEVDPKYLSTLLSNGKDAHALMEGWRGTLKNLAIGEESEDMLREIEQYNETGMLDPKLRARLQEAIDEAARDQEPLTMNTGGDEKEAT